jgi:O-antigen/teichoic acid export membrane protein
MKVEIFILLTLMIQIIVFGLIYIYRRFMVKRGYPEWNFKVLPGVIMLVLLIFAIKLEHYLLFYLVNLILVTFGTVVWLLIEEKVKRKSQKKVKNSSKKMTR